MKKMILAVAALTLTATSAFAQYNSNRCEVDLIDTRTNRIITTIRATDYNDGCKEGMKACRLEIRQRGLLNRADCIRATQTNPGPQNPYPDTNPYPNPYPDTNPYPGPQTGYDARRMINIGESVILNNKYVTVLGATYGGQQFAVRSTDGWNTITNGVRRESLSVTNGCNLQLCTSDSVIDINSAKYVKVIALSYDDRFVTQSTDGWNTIASGLDRSRLAETKQGSCAFSRYGGQICVGHQVINQQNRYSTVVGIQLDGRVVLRSTDGWNTISTNISPENLVITGVR